MSEKFNLKWNDFQANVSRSFGLFRNESYLHDVTLVSDDFKQIPAHKLVLSTTSEYFRNILQQTKQSQPLICLDGVNSEDLKNILDYVYDGEVKIHQEDLDRFLNIAQKLKLEGLLSNEDENQEDEVDLHTSNVKGNESFDDSSFDIVTTFNSNKRVRSKEQPNRVSNNVSKAKLIAFENGENLSEEDHKKRLQENVQVNVDGTASCKICGKIFRGAPKAAKSNAKIHVEVHIEGLNYTCSQCDKTFRSKNALNCHVYQTHR